MFLKKKKLLDYKSFFFIIWKCMVIKYIYLLSQKMILSTGISIENLILKCILAFLFTISQLKSIGYRYP